MKVTSCASATIAPGQAHADAIEPEGRALQVPSNQEQCGKTPRRSWRPLSPAPPEEPESQMRPRAAPGPGTIGSKHSRTSVASSAVEQHERLDEACQREQPRTRPKTSSQFTHVLLLDRDREPLKSRKVSAGG